MLVMLLADGGYRTTANTPRIGGAKLLIGQSEIEIDLKAGWAQRITVAG